MIVSAVFQNWFKNLSPEAMSFLAFVVTVGLHIILIVPLMIESAVSDVEYLYKKAIEQSVIKNRQTVETLVAEHKNEKVTLENKIGFMMYKLRSREQTIDRLRKINDIYQASFIEKANGFTTVFDGLRAIQEFLDNRIITEMLSKPRPALKTTEQLKEHSRLKREAQKEARINRSIIEYYEKMYPELIEIRENELESSEPERVIDVAYTEKEKEDPVSQFISKIEYDKLSSSERNQLALDRYWKRRHSSVHLGKMYERYVGYLFEKDGYDVEYVGISKKLKDMERDLICTKGKTIVVVQCKYWSKHKNVYENRVFQHFGTVYEYKQQHKEKRVTGALYSTTEVAEDAKNIAKILKIKVVENHTFDKSYPCIKCNIGRDGAKIYHLPFDQQYDNIKIEPSKGEFYAATIKEAEKAGFRHAYRFKGLK